MIAAQEEHRRERAERYLALLDRAPDVIYAHDQIGRFIFANSAAERLTGYRRDELLGRNFAEFIPPPSTW